MPDQTEEFEFADEQEDIELAGSVSAVVQGTDWTTETIVAQMRRRNIVLNPSFQRRDAWSISRKSELIESLIVGLPVPQIVLAEAKNERGKFIVLDGKQRLLSLLQFWGESDGDNNAFRLSKLKLRPKLSRVNFAELSTDPQFDEDYNSLCNESIRTMVIRNWANENLLHEVFLRLNTGSVKLSPQELRQALEPGPFTTYVDEVSGELESLQELLRITRPDPRMRDVEILSRYIAFRFLSQSYTGRMKDFLDFCFRTMNAGWTENRGAVEAAVQDFDNGLVELLLTFDGRPARKPNSPQFNRAIFDALIYFHANAEVRAAASLKRPELKNAYNSLFAPGSRFSVAVESDTAGKPNTLARFQEWARCLNEVLDLEHPVSAPLIPIEEAM